MAFAKTFKIVKAKMLSQNVHKVITDHHNHRMEYLKISKEFDIHILMIRADIQRWKQYSLTKNLPQTRCACKLSKHEVTIQLIESNMKPIRYLELQKNLKSAWIEMSKDTISQTFYSVGLQSRVTRKTFLLKINPINSGLLIAHNILLEDFSFWDKILWSDEKNLDSLGETIQNMHEKISAFYITLKMLYQKLNILVKIS